MESGTTFKEEDGFMHVCSTTYLAVAMIYSKAVAKERVSRKQYRSVNNQAHSLLSIVLLT